MAYAKGKLSEYEKHQKNSDMEKKILTSRRAMAVQRSLTESFLFQVWWGRDQKAKDIPDDSPFLLAEIRTICNLALERDILSLRDIIQNVRKDCGIYPIADRGTLVGSPMAYLLGITQENPMDNDRIDMCLADQGNVTVPFQIEVYYDSEIRNKVVDWVRERYEGLTTRLGQPILKLEKSVIHFKRTVK